MKSLIISAIGAMGTAILALTTGCGGGSDATEQAADLEAASEPKVSFPDEDIEVCLKLIGDPQWKPVDFHQFSAPYSAFFAIGMLLLPPPKHLPHPDLGIGPGQKHGGPYDHELDDAVEHIGFEDSNGFSAKEFTTGVYLTWMNIPTKNGAPKGSSPDFKNGRIIPNDIFPIHVDIKYSRNGVVDSAVSEVIVPPLDSSITPSFKVEGHSHFPMFSVDSSEFYGGAPAEGEYLWMIRMTDADGNGWDIEVPYEIE